jgi:hypothetical protein
MRAGMFGLENHFTVRPDSVAHGDKLSGNNPACLGDGNRPAEGQSRHHCYPAEPYRDDAASDKIDFGDVISPSTAGKELSISVVLAHIDGGWKHDHRQARPIDQPSQSEFRQRTMSQ